MARHTPVVALLIGLMGLMMLVPCIQAASDGEWRSARGFLYPCVFVLIGACAVGVLSSNQDRRETAQRELVSLITLWLLLPFVAALPLVLLTPAIGWSGAWFEMVAALTTTGDSVYARASSVPDSIHLWRGMVGWMGGLLTLMAAYVVLAPRRLGGFEVVAAADGLPEMRSVDLRATGAAFHSRSRRALRTILPVYGGMTLILGIAFSAAGKPGLTAAVHAMSVVSTSGISPLDGGFSSGSNYLVEIFALVFMAAAATRLLYAGASQTGRRQSWRDDPELVLLAVLVGAATFLLFLRHWVGALSIDEGTTALDGLEALWGAFFTSVSFITTTGFKSFGWESARDWSGLANPGLVLLGLCIIGGGAATTAGGIKLIRGYALMRHGLREVERIAMPHSVAGPGSAGRGLRREGAFIAWAFMMLFLLALMGTVLGLTLSGMAFSPAFIAAVAALSNTGPAFPMVAEGQTFAMLDTAQRAILAIAMVLGRIETLAVIAMFNLDAWSQRRGRTKKTGNSPNQPPISRW